MDSKGDTSQTHGRSYVGALVLIASIMQLPIAASLITAVIHISTLPQALQNLREFIVSWLGPEWTTIAVSLFITLIIWLVLAAFTQNMTTMDSANSLSAIHLKNHLNTLQIAFDVLDEPVRGMSSDSSHYTYEQNYCLAYEQVKMYLSKIRAEIGRSGTCWVSARGYLYGWNLLHRAEEAMMILQSREEVIREAWHDEMSLEGSAMDSGNTLLQKLRKAVEQLSPLAAHYLNQQPNGELSNSNVNTGTVGGDTTSPMSASNGKVAEEDPDGMGSVSKSNIALEKPSSSTSIYHNGAAGVDAKSEIEARDALRDVRKTLNEYRDGLWEGLVSLRNQLMGTAFITGLFTYILLCFVLIARASPTSIKAAIAFYLAGALIGLFSRLYNESQAEKLVNDFNLPLARLLITPVISGLAAVGGILFLATLTVTLTQTSNSGLQSVIGNSFDLNKNALGILIAATFGFAPNLFINTLQARAKDVTTQLLNSTPTNQGYSDQGTSTQGTAGKGPASKANSGK